MRPAQMDGCEDCPISITYSISGELILQYSQMPSWAGHLYPAYYIAPDNTTHGPFLPVPNADGTKYKISGFPSQYCCPLNGSLVLGGTIQCNYLEHGVLEGCIKSDPDCNCPIIMMYPDNPFEITFAFENNSSPTFPYPEPVDLTLKWGQNVSGPFPVSWIAGPRWQIHINEPTPCCAPFNGEIIMNDEKKCTYVNNIAVACGSPAFTDLCEHLAECQTELSEFIVNVPGSGCAKWEIDCNSISPLKRFGKTKIGNVPVPDGYKLAVDGGIMTDYIKVELCGTGGWCDYVFKNDYKLMSLKEIKEFIRLNNHLPDSPSTEDIKNSGGIEVKTTMLNHQEKIEEIFLYLIDLQDKIGRLKQEAELLEAENNFLRIINNNN